MGSGLSTSTTCLTVVKPGTTTCSRDMQQRYAMWCWRAPNLKIANNKSEHQNCSTSSVRVHGNSVFPTNKNKWGWCLFLNTATGTRHFKRVAQLLYYIMVLRAEQVMQVDEVFL